MIWTSPGDETLPLVVSYFTDPGYLNRAWDLARSCQAHRLAYEIAAVADRGSWLANTNHKPTHLLELARRLPDRDLLWLDADARVRRSPELLRSLRATVAYHTWVGRPASGTVFLGATREREWLLERWVRAVEQDPNATDQVCLGRAVAALGLVHLELPVEYCAIYDFERRGFKIKDPEPRASDAAVVEHMQASRWTRWAPDPARKAHA